MQPVPPHISLASGGFAGLCVDVALFPLDTVKTRLQSPHGFVKAGGFTGVYNGLSAAAGGSMPSAGLFFCTYESVKPHVAAALGSSNAAAAQAVAASVAETAACLVRVPTEVVKQRMQIGEFASLRQALPTILKTEGVGRLYSGFGVTIMRDIPFSCIQFPIYEGLKVAWARAQGGETSALQGAACGSLAGGVAAAATCPLDVVKTRLMLGADKHGVAYASARDVAGRVVRDEGAATLLSGIQPRVGWTTVGGFVFFGAYEFAKKSLLPVSQAE